MKKACYAQCYVPIATLVPRPWMRIMQLLLSSHVGTRHLDGSFLLKYNCNTFSLDARFAAKYPGCGMHSEWDV